jgi:hypothetical protein
MSLAPSLRLLSASSGAARIPPFLLTVVFSKSANARAQSSGAFLYSRDTTGTAFRRLPLIGFSFTGWDSQALNLSVNERLKFVLPTLARLSDEEES